MVWKFQYENFEKNNIADQPKYFGIKNDLEIKLKVWMEQQGDLGIETEMKAVSRQNREGKGEWLPYKQKNSKG